MYEWILLISAHTFFAARENAYLAENLIVAALLKIQICWNWCVSGGAFKSRATNPLNPTILNPEMTKS